MLNSITWFCGGLILFPLLLTSVPVMAWQQTGGPAAVVTVLAVNHISPQTVYAGTSGGGMFKSTDGGSSWGAVNTGLTGTAVYSLAIDPAFPQTLYAGTDGLGVYKSTDGGANWGPVKTGITYQSVYTLAVDPNTHQTVYAGTLGGGVFKSTDGGGNWSAANTGLTNSYVNSLAVDPSNSQTVYAGTNGGVFRSTNGGGNWSAVNTGIPIAIVYSLAIDPYNPQTIYAGTRTGGVFKSTDGGASWGPVNNGLTSAYVQTLATDSVTHAVYAGTNGGGVFKSTNGGGSWGAVSNGLTSTYVLSLAIDPVTHAVYAGPSGGGVIKTTNGGGSWGAVNSGLIITSVAYLAIDPATPQTMYAGADYYGVFKTTNGGGSWSTVNTGLALFSPSIFVQALAIAPSTPQTLYVSTYSGVFRTTNGGGSWSAVNTGLTSSGNVRSLAVDPTDPQTVYAGTIGGGVFKSINGGTNWGPVNTGLTTLNVYPLVIDPTDHLTLYAGSNGGGAFKSTNGGANWGGINNNLTSTNVGPLAIDPSNPQTVYAGTYGAGLFKTANGGSSWSAINSGQPNNYVFSLAIDPVTPQTLYAVTRSANGIDTVFMTANGGSSWGVFNNGLPAMNVFSLAIDPVTPRNVYAGTHGGGVFKLDVPGQLAVAGFASPAPASTPQSFTVTAQDGGGAMAGTYRGTVHFTSSDPAAVLPADYTFTVADGGSHTFVATLNTPGTQSITATDTVQATITGTQAGIVAVGPVTGLVVTGFPSVSWPGRFGYVTVTAVDANGNRVAGYSGTVSFGSTDPLAVTPANYTFVPADNGSHTFGVTLNTLGTQSITITDTINITITGTLTGITVGPPPSPAVTLAVSGFPSPTTAGVGHNITVTAMDAGGNTDIGYTGTVRLTSSDPQLSPIDYTFVSTDLGTKTLAVSLSRAGTQSITATDKNNASIVGTQSGIQVINTTASAFSVSGFPATIGRGVTGSFTVTAVDSYGNTVTNYAGKTVFFESGDTKATLPAPYLFDGSENGSRTFNAAFGTYGMQYILASDHGVYGEVRGEQNSIQVVPVAKSLVVSGFPSPAEAGASETFTVTVYDDSGNIHAGYRGTVAFISQDPLAVLPANFTFTPADAGVHTFHATLNTLGPQDLQALDNTNGLSGGQSGIQVTHRAYSFVVTGLPYRPPYQPPTTPVTIPDLIADDPAHSIEAGEIRTITVTAVDSMGNPVTDYVGNVHFSTDCPLSNLPGDYRFVPSDQGIHMFTLSLYQTGKWDSVILISNQQTYWRWLNKIWSLEVSDTGTGTSRPTEVQVYHAPVSKYEMYADFLKPVGSFEFVPPPFSTTGYVLVDDWCDIFAAATDMFGNLITDYPLDHPPWSYYLATADDLDVYFRSFNWSASTYSYPVFGDIWGNFENYGHLGGPQTGLAALEPLLNGLAFFSVKLHAPGQHSVDLLGADGIRGTFPIVAANPPNQWLLSVTINSVNGGGGTVTGTPSGINNVQISCISGSSVNCSSTYTAGTLVTLIPTVSGGSTFGGWSNNCTLSGTNCQVTVSADKTVTATFNGSSAFVVQLVGSPSQLFATIQAAYTAAGTGATSIKAQAVTLIEDVLMNDVGKTIFIHGGYDAGFNTQTGYTTIQGKLAIGQGVLIADRLIVR